MLRYKYLLLILVFILMAAGYGVWVYYNRLHPSTNDAYVQAYVVRVAPQVSGIVDHVYVDSYQMVHKGDVLFTIDTTPFSIRLHKAESQLEQVSQGVEGMVRQVEQARADVAAKRAAQVNAEQEWQRVKPLVKRSVLPKAKGDKAEAALKEAEAALRASQEKLASIERELGESGKNNPRIQAALADVDAARLDISYTTVTAAVDGLMGEVSLRPGSSVSAGQEVMQLVDTRTWWVEANFKETDLSRIHGGQPAQISVDILPDAHFSGTVLSISPASGASMSIFPPEDATGNWVKVTRRFPVRVMIDTDDNGNDNSNASASDLRVGASATVTVDTTGDANKDHKETNGE